MDDEKVKVTETTSQSNVATPGAAKQTKQVTTAQSSTPSGLVMAERVVYFLVSLLEVLLLFRFVLSLLGANRGNGFADFIFGMSAPFIQPFLNLFNYQTAYGVSRFELETLVAAIAYAVLGALIVALIRLPRGSTTTEV